MSSRAHLLAGLRTGGPRSSSPFSADAEFQQQQDQYDHAQLNASAAPFTPGGCYQAHAQSQAQVNMMQMEAFRLQVANYQQQQQQQLAAQQRLVLAQVQAEAELQAYQQQQQQAYTAHERRLAAQATIQANLRQRQVQQQMYAQLQMQQQAAFANDGSYEAQQEHEALLQRLQYLRQLQLNASTRQVSPMGHPAATEAESAKSWRSTSTSVLKRSSNPVQQKDERNGDLSHDLAEAVAGLSFSGSETADAAKSWRSTSTSVLKKKKAKGDQSPPSIVVDDSETETSSSSEPGETPETSEEDIHTSIKAVASLSSSRPTSLSAAPRLRTASADVKLATGATGSRQPRGPPTEFLAVNFAARLSARTRREAMSKLCASPRAASFSHAIMA